MATDRSLATLLRALQSDFEGQDISRLLSSATTLLTLLSNPLNVTLLTSQLLTAPAIWHRPDGLRTTIRILSIAVSASRKVLQYEQEGQQMISKPLHITTRLSKDGWFVAVVKGADDRSPRWRHLLVLGGLLLGLEGQHPQALSRSFRSNLEHATITTVNLALQEAEFGDDLASNSIATVLSHVVDLLSPSYKAEINYDLLLPTLVRGPYFSKEGLHLGYFLSVMDADVVQAGGSKFDWSTKSSTYVQLERMASGPMVASLGLLSRLTAVSVENVRSLDLLATVLDDLSTFTRSLCVQWRQNKLSEIDITEESTFLSDESLKTSLPLLWRVLKSSMFAVVVILRSLVGRVIGESNTPLDRDPSVAVRILQMLRDLYFISSRLGANVFSQYTFVYLVALDILSQYPAQAEAYLRELKPSQAGQIPQHPLDRCFDLYFMNTAEHFTLILTPEVNEQLLIAAATPYLGVGGNQRLLQMFEAAHSIMLAVLSAPQNSVLVAKHIYTYVDILFKVFPQTLSSRQYRMATKTLIRITSPPSPLSQSQPVLPSTILELILERVGSASSQPLRKSSLTPALRGNVIEEPDLSEQAVYIMSMIDALPLVPIEALEEWLPIVADTLRIVQDSNMLHTCKQRFWEVLSSGEMDVNRAAQCVAWWSTQGGREVVLRERTREEGPFMSGALGEMSKL